MCVLAALDMILHFYDARCLMQLQKRHSIINVSFRVALMQPKNACDCIFSCKKVPSANKVFVNAADLPHS